MTTTAAAHRGDILVVDDTPENLSVLSAVLKERGYRVRAAPSGPLALRAVEAEAPDLILLDVNMPGMDGYEVCRALKARDALRGIPVLFLSALSETLDKVKAFAAGGVDYITKPFRAEEIAARLETHLALRRLQLELEGRNQELERSYARLRELERVRQALVQMIVHDLKNPLAAMAAGARFLRRNVPAGGDADVREAVEDLHHLSEVMTRMVVDVLDVTRAEEAGLKVRLGRVDVAPLLEAVVQETRALVRTAGSQLSLAVQPGLAAVSADGELLRRVLQNLLDNAVKYAPSGSEIRLEAARAGAAGWVLRVSDDGPGIPADQREAIFEPWRRLERDAGHAARTSRGLGLAFCRLAAQAHGGQIRVEDHHPRGTTFVLELPLEPKPPAR